MIAQWTLKTRGEFFIGWRRVDDQMHDGAPQLSQYNVLMGEVITTSELRTGRCVVLAPHRIWSGFDMEFCIGQWMERQPIPGTTPNLRVVPVQEGDE